MRTSCAMRSPYIEQIADDRGDLVEILVYCGEFCARGTGAAWWPGYEASSCEYCADCGDWVVQGVDCAGSCGELRHIVPA